METPLKYNQSLHCQYNQERGHIAKDSRTLWKHLDQLVGEGRLQQFLYHLDIQGGQARSGAQGSAFSRPLLGIINVIFTAPGKNGSHPSRVMFVARLPVKESNSEPKRARVEVQLSLSFLNEDKIGTIQPHNDALVVTLRIGGYDVKRIMVDQDSCAKIMYLDLYRGLNLRSEDLTAYDSPLVSFDEKLVNLKGQIRLPVQAGSKVVEVDFIMVMHIPPTRPLWPNPGFIP